MSEICRKDLLARNMNRMLKLFRKDYNIFPQTWCLPADYVEFQAYQRSRKNKTFICKPDSGCQGKGIFITRKPQDIRPGEHLICQQYISKPFIVDGFKLDLRLYVLVTSCDPLRVFLYREGLVRFATSRYSQPNSSNLNDVFMHLTNYAINKHNANFIQDEETGSKRMNLDSGGGSGEEEEEEGEEEEDSHSEEFQTGNACGREQRQCRVAEVGESSYEGEREGENATRINHFPGMSEICRKDLLARNMNRMLKLFRKDYNIFPQTWCLPADYVEFQAYQRSRKNKTFICKPDSGCQGKGIFITRKPQDIRPGEHLICQQYISKPFIVDGFKLDLRLYVLVTSCDPLRVFLYREGLVRFATSRYSQPNSSNLVTCLRLCTALQEGAGWEEQYVCRVENVDMTFLKHLATKCVRCTIPSEIAML
ncbi:Tubulin polyglutamylase ttll6 [Acipenser ruthenus]|uniref:Tubulin polyglutamylase ttll6 n=1 Tax=Acipenser ruthenus TaxID=7906 RepID=A0A662YQL4_ACIRT|nr:Tubulin polyglutamylase ttll6 [Acipenser ruthenus]